MRTAAIIAIAFVLVVLLVWLFVTHRSFVTLRNLVQEGRRRIDLELNARYGLISDFVEIVAAHSKDTRPLEDVITARSAAAGPASGMAGRGQREDALSRAITRVLTWSQHTGNLSSDESFIAIRNELANISARINEASRFYNANARDLNAKRESFPSSLVASAFHFDHVEYFQAEP